MVSPVTIPIITLFEAQYTALRGADHRSNWISLPDNFDALIVVPWLERLTDSFGQQLLITLISKILNRLA